MSTLATSHQLTRAVAALAVLYLAGTAWAVSAGLAPLGDAVVNGSYLSAPLPIIGAQALGALLAWRLRRRAPAVLTLLACTASLAAVAFDGDLGHAGLGAAQVAFQVVISVVTLVAWCLAVGVLGAGER